MKVIRTERAPQPAGHYSQAIVHGGLVYVAGQLGIDPADRGRGPGTAAEQTEQALRNVAAILEAAGSRLDRVLQMTVYVAEMELWQEVNDAYARVLGAHRPARAIVPTSEFRGGYTVEVQAIASAAETD